MREYNPPRASRSSCIPASAMTVLENHDPISLGKGRETLRAQNYRGALALRALRAKSLAQRCNDTRLRLDIDRGEGIVQHEQTRRGRSMCGDRACETHALALAAGNSHAQLPDLRVQSLGQAADVRVERSEARRSRDCL